MKMKGSGGFVGVEEEEDMFHLAKFDKFVKKSAMALRQLEEGEHRLEIMRKLPKFPKFDDVDLYYLGVYDYDDLQNSSSSSSSHKEKEKEEKDQKPIGCIDQTHRRRVSAATPVRAVPLVDTDTEGLMTLAVAACSLQDDDDERKELMEDNIKPFMKKKRTTVTFPAKLMTSEYHQRRPLISQFKLPTSEKPLALKPVLSVCPPTAPEMSKEPKLTSDHQNRPHIILRFKIPTSDQKLHVSQQENRNKKPTPPALHVKAAAATHQNSGKAPLKRQRIDFEYGDEDQTMAKKRMKETTTTIHLPPDLKNQIEKLHGSEEIFLIQKTLYKTDLNKHNARLSLPSSQISLEFLKPEEKARLSTKNGKIEAGLIQPCGKLSSICLNKWDMGTPIYNLVTGWNDVVREKKNKLHLGMELQVWAFRVGSKLWFALNEV